MIAFASISLPGRAPSDPADRIIIATALSLGAKLVTKDETIRAYEVSTIW